MRAKIFLDAVPMELSVVISRNDDELVAGGDEGSKRREHVAMSLRDVGELDAGVIFRRPEPVSALLCGYLGGNGRPRRLQRDADEIDEIAVDDELPLPAVRGRFAVVPEQRREVFVHAFGARRRWRGRRIADVASEVHVREDE